MADSFFHRKLVIESARIKMARELMKEYDETVYNPARKALREECAKVGHTPDERWDFTVLGRGYQHCSGCGITLWEEETTE